MRVGNTYTIATVAFIENLIEFRVTNRRFTFLLKSYCLTVLKYRNCNMFNRFHVIHRSEMRKKKNTTP